MEMETETETDRREPASFSFVESRATGIGLIDTVEKQNNDSAENRIVFTSRGLAGFGTKRNF